MSKQTEKKQEIDPDTKLVLTKEKKVAKSHSEEMKEAYEKWATELKAEQEKYRKYKFRCKCPACGMVNFDNDHTKVIVNIPHKKDCAYIKTGETYTFNAEVN